MNIEFDDMANFLINNPDSPLVSVQFVWGVKSLIDLPLTAQVIGFKIQEIFSHPRAICRPCPGFLRGATPVKCASPLLNTLRYAITEVNLTWQAVININ